MSHQMLTEQTAMTIVVGRLADNDCIGFVYVTCNAQDLHWHLFSPNAMSRHMLCPCSPDVLMYYTCALPHYAAGMYGDDRFHINGAAV